ncbi:MAG TPA: type II toxin-antitoxin system VapC family toxin [Nitriliruptorales bacterium]
MTVVLDASAVLALVYDEPGADRVAACVDGAVLSVANLAEVLAKHVDRGVDPEGVAWDLGALGMRLEPVTSTDAQLQARVRSADLAAHDGRPKLSLGDRLCLATAWRLGLSTLTADDAWTDLDLPLEVTHIR